MEQVFAILYQALVTVDWIVRQRNMQVAANTAKTLLSAHREGRAASRVFEDLAAIRSDELQGDRPYTALCEVPSLHP